MNVPISQKSSTTNPGKVFTAVNGLITYLIVNDDTLHFSYIHCQGMVDLPTTQPGSFETTHLPARTPLGFRQLIDRHLGSLVGFREAALALDHAVA